MDNPHKKFNRFAALCSSLNWSSNLFSLQNYKRCKIIADAKDMAVIQLRVTITNILWMFQKNKQKV